MATRETISVVAKNDRFLDFLTKNVKNDSKTVDNEIPESSLETQNDCK